MSSEGSESDETCFINEQEHRILEKKGYKVDEKSFSKGSFASVFKAKLFDIQLAIKVIDCDKIPSDFKNRFLPRELYVLNKLKHRFIIEKKEILTINNKVFIVMELAEGGDLNIYIKQMKRIEETKAKILFRQLCEGLNYIHSQAIAHRDIKCENILLNKRRDVAKLTDFGFARTCFDNLSGRRLLTQTQCGSLAFVGPELLKGEPFDAIINDCWSMGILVYCMTVGEIPFSPRLHTKQLLVKQLNKSFPLNEQKLSEDCKNIITKLLEPNTKTRMNMKQALNHNWIKDVKV